MREKRQKFGKYINNSYICKINKKMIRQLNKLLIAALLSISAITAFSAPDSTIVFTEKQPLVYEDAWDLWPYSFLNDSGEPVGYNIDLLKLICKELNIPYIVKLKPTHDALNDLKAGRANLMCAMDANFHDEYAHYGMNVIQMFTHSVVHRKNEPLLLKNADDLANHRVIVHAGSFSHHYMIDHGWGKNAIPYNDMHEAIQYVHSHPGSMIVWNTVSLNWLLQKFNYNDLELSPINLQHGEYKFMSSDEHLLRQFDSVFSYLNSTGQLQAIQYKWFYPEHKDTGIPSWVWYMVVALLVVTALFLAYYVFSRFYERRMTKTLQRSNDRLSLILNTSKVHIWLYDIASQMVTSFEPNGKKITKPFSPDFGQYYVGPEDYERICILLNDMVSLKKQGETLELKAIQSNSKKEYIFSVDFSVMKRDKNGKPTVIIGATRDITKIRQRQQQQKDTMLRYRHIFNSTLIDAVSYNEKGIIDDMNEKAVKGIGGDMQRIIDSQISIQSVLGEPDLHLDDLDYTYLTQIYRSTNDERALNKILNRDELYYELQLVPLRDDDGQLLGIYANGRDVTGLAKSYSRLQKKIAKLEEATAELQDYARNIDYVMRKGGVRVVNYSPDTHTLTIFSETGHVQQKLTQTRLLTLTDEESKKTAQRMMNIMDNLTQQPVKEVVKTTLKLKHPLYLYFSIVPVTDANGTVTKYFGMCRDISDIKATEKQLALETKKAQEVEMVKNAFLHNMCYEIRTPLTSVVGFAELMEMNPDSEDEKSFIEQIKINSRILLNLVNNILLLSRLDAGMIEFKPEPVDFANFFESHCRDTWLKYGKSDINFIVDSPYKNLMLNIDLNNLGIVIDQLLINAAQFTNSGEVRTHFDYNGEDLTVAVQDTGIGIPAEQHEKIFERFVSINGSSSGLGLPICQEVVKLMGGRIHMKSKAGEGTIFWIIIPTPSDN